MHPINICNWYSLSISSKKREVDLSWMIWILFQCRFIHLFLFHFQCALFTKPIQCAHFEWDVQWSGSTKYYNRLDFQLNLFVRNRLNWNSVPTTSSHNNGFTHWISYDAWHSVNRLLTTLKYGSKMENRRSTRRFIGPLEENGKGTVTDATSVGRALILNIQTINVSINTAWGAIIQELWALQCENEMNITSGLQ